MVTRDLISDIFTNPHTQLNKINRFWLGADDMFDNMRRLTKAAGLPHDIKKISDDMYVIEIAVAGFKRDELKVELLKDGIKVAGSHNEEEQVEYLWRGIAKRSFDLLFPVTFTEGFEVGTVSLKDGLLRIVIQVKKTPLGRMLEIKSEENEE